jgi:hypothetical protein
MNPISDRTTKLDCMDHEERTDTTRPSVVGPCIGMDTACSSSLVATHLAHRGLLDGETTAALSAGVNLMLVASTSTNLAALGALSSNGRSKTFEATADGYGRGEGCVVVAMRLAAEGQSGGCHAIVQGESILLSTSGVHKRGARAVEQRSMENKIWPYIVQIMPVNLVVAVVVPKILVYTCNEKYRPGLFVSRS